MTTTQLRTTDETLAAVARQPIGDLWDGINGEFTWADDGAITADVPGGFCENDHPVALLPELTPDTRVQIVDQHDQPFTVATVAFAERHGCERVAARVWRTTAV